MRKNAPENNLSLQKLVHQKGHAMNVRRTHDWLDYARLLSGVLCLAAGLAKPFPQIENIPLTLQNMALANANTALAPLSDIIVRHTTLTLVLVAFGLIASGTAFLVNRFIVPAALGQIFMLALFVTLLFRFQPAIVIIDFPFIVIAAILMRRELKKRHQTQTRGVSA
jgi:hypothetical protein